MSGIEKIVAHIDEDTSRDAAQLLASAQKQAERLRAEADARAGEADAAASQETERKTALIAASGESAAHKEGKNLLLAARRDLLAQTFDRALAQLRALSGQELFGALENIVVQNAQPGEGKLILSETDASALPSDFVSRCNARIANGSVSLSDERRVTNGGVILQYGPIEINCTFGEMLSASRTQLEDEVCRILFR